MGMVAGDRRRECWPVAREGATAVWGTTARKGRWRCGEPPRGRGGGGVGATDERARRRWGITAERARRWRWRDDGDGVREE
jgi:hypothetical protein